jgi:DNA-binding winged helix-turn-helix (wHTH) protein/WD40 repeat protein
MAKVIPFRPKRAPPGAADSRDVARRPARRYNADTMPAQIETALDAAEPFLVGEWLVEPRLNRLTRGDTSVQLELKAMDVLLCLAAQVGEVVAKHELFDAVWQTEFVSDNTLARRIADLREALGDDAQNPRYIETIRKRGYRLIATVGVRGTTTETAATFPEALPTPPEELNPYPGLSPFTEADAAHFFGRETEVAALWRKISARRLLAVVGPSGIGKTSLLRAGVVPAAPAGWRALVLTPGEAPSLALGRALAPDHAGDPAALPQLVGFTDPDTALAVVARWRGLWRGAVLIFDQFEELFTLSPPEVQESFIELLRRLVDAADVHVVLSVRDDFLLQCHRFPRIAPIFKDLTPVGPPGADALRRALKEPAARQLYRFESELLVDEMIADVEAERGALPLLAFAVHRLWQERDRERRVLTREAYLRIGGVAGALARHAEGTLDRIGAEHLPLVRELFRNLVSAGGTRAVREWDELLSVFAERDREATIQVLRELIDARLLTTYEVVDDAEKPSRRVEIIHESLLAAWPRLVRWQTQDADAAQLRDQLRQAARTWHERGRSDDLLWTRQAFREFALWRERYPGRLTDTEDAFSSAMTDFAGRRRRRRRLVVGSIVAALVIGLTVTGTLWQRSVRAARAAEAHKLNALGRLELDSHPSATLAHAIASLELADSREARLLALEALWKGPTSFVMSPEEWTHWGEFSRDGRWLVQTIWGPPARLRLIHSDGTAEELPQAHAESERVAVGISPESDYFWSHDATPEPTPRTFALWSAPAGRLLAEARYGASSWIVRSTWSGRRALLQVVEGGRAHIDVVGVDGSRERLGTVAFAFPNPQLWYMHTSMDEWTGRWFGAVVNNEVLVLEIGEHGLSEPRRLGRHEGPIAHFVFDPFGRFLVTAGVAGDIRLWDPTGGAPPTALHGPAGILGMGLKHDGSHLGAVARDSAGEVVLWIWHLAEDEPRLVRRLDLSREVGYVAGNPISRQVAQAASDSTIRLWTQAAPAAAEPLALRSGDLAYPYRRLSFHPQGRWLAATNSNGLTLWPLARRYPVVIQVHDKEVWTLAFDPQGRWLVSTSLDGTVRLWPLADDAPDRVRVLLDEPGVRMGYLAVSPDGSRLLVSSSSGVRLIPLDGEAPRTLEGFRGAVGPVAFSPDGRLAAGIRSRGVGKIDVWDVASGRTLKVIDPVDTSSLLSIGFTSDGRLLASSVAGLRQWDLEARDSELLVEDVTFFGLSADRQRWFLAGFTGSRYVHSGAILDLDTGVVTPLERHGDRIVSGRLDPAGDVVVTASDDGTIRVGPATGEEPHLLLGHKDVLPLAVDPLGRWIAAAVDRTKICLWPMPDLSRPPLHTLPRGELLAKLRSLTNVRLVPDEDSPTGWTLTHEPFQGWETVPTW